MNEEGSVDSISSATFGEVVRWVEGSIRQTPFLFGVGGPGGCGKTTLSRWLLRRLPGSELLPLDDFRLPREQRKLRGLYGSHPDGNDIARLMDCLRAARRGEEFERPVFDLKSGRAETSVVVPPCRILICDGEIAAHAAVRAEMDGLVLVEAHWRTQLNTRLTRDLRQRECSLEKAIEIFLQSNLRDYPLFSNGAADDADFVLYRNSKNRFAIRKRPMKNTSIPAPALLFYPC